MAWHPSAYPRRHFFITPETLKYIFTSALMGESIPTLKVAAALIRPMFRVGRKTARNWDLRLLCRSFIQAKL